MKTNGKQLKVIVRHLKSQMLYSGVKKIQVKFLEEIKGKYSNPIKKEIKDLFKKVNPNKEDLELFGSKFQGQVFTDVNNIINQITNEAIQNEVIRKYSEGNKITIYLSKNGDLYLEPKEEYCYKMEKDSIRHKIISILKDQDDSYSTQEIMKDSDVKNARSIRDAVGHINKNAEKFLSIQNTEKKRLIINEGDGYKINSLYYIFQK